MRFFTVAREGNNTWPLYIVGVLLSLGGYFIGQLPLSLVLVYQVSSRTDLGPQDITAFQEDMDFSKFGINPNMGFFLMIMIFVFAMIGLYAAVRVHGKKWIHLITPSHKINFKKIFFGLGLWAILILVSELITYCIDSSQYAFRFSFSSFVPLLFLALFLLPIQTSFEEMFFRGYLMQGFGLATRNKLWAIFLSSACFSLMHGTNPEIQEFGFWTMMFYYVSAGAFLALITVMDDSLELALGVHAATNILGATLVTYTGSVLKTETLFVVSEIKPWLMIFLFYISAVIFYLVCSSRYGWPSLRTLWESITFTDSDRKGYIVES